MDSTEIKQTPGLLLLLLLRLLICCCCCFPLAFHALLMLLLLCCSAALFAIFPALLLASSPKSGSLPMCACARPFTPPLLFEIAGVLPQLKYARQPCTRPPCPGPPRISCVFLSCAENVSFSPPLVTFSISLSLSLSQRVFSLNVGGV